MRSSDRPDTPMNVATLKDKKSLPVVDIDAELRAFEEAERHQRVQKIASRPGMQSEPAGQRFGVGGMLSQFRENADFHRAEQYFGRPEAEPDLQNVFRG